MYRKRKEEKKGRKERERERERERKSEPNRKNLVERELCIIYGSRDKMGNIGNGMKAFSGGACGHIQALWLDCMLGWCSLGYWEARTRDSAAWATGRLEPGMVQPGLLGG